MTWSAKILYNLPIKRKLAITTGVTVAAALALSCGALLWYETTTFREELKRDAASTAQMVGLTSAAGLSFRDTDAVDQALRGLRAQPDIIAAGVYDSSGALFARYQRIPDAGFAWPKPADNAAEFGSGWLDLQQPVMAAAERIGTIYLRCDLKPMRLRLQHSALIATLIIVVATIAALLIAARLQRVISDPISALASVAERVASEKNYALRATNPGEDELGRLINRFNEMLTQIQARDAALQAAHDQLEKRVEQRTAELANSLSLNDATLEATNDGILAMNLNGQITCYNARFATIWKLPAELLDRKERSEILPMLAEQAKDPNQFLERVAAIHRAPELVTFDLIELSDGRTIERYVHPQIIDHRIVGLVISCRDITERKRAEAELARTHRELLDTSRLAGMAEVATGVLHNVGNVLTSVNVSATIISDQVRSSKAAMVRKVSDLLRENASDLATFLTTHPKGQQVPEYLEVLAKQIASEHGDMLREMEALTKHIAHIRDIVAMQQSYAKVSGIAENINIVELVEDAVQMNAGGLQRHEVTLVREFHAKPVVAVQKHKVLQILVNLIRNAKHACDDTGRSDKRIHLRITEANEFVQVAVIDNGVGIPAENLTRIFSHGFTTRKNGHGFGLHSGALAAKEIGGALSVHSGGAGLGATFTLSIPTQLKAAA